MGNEEKESQIIKAGATLAPITPEGLISQAMANGATTDVLKDLLAMRKELKAEQAKEAYDEAMSNFQSQCPIIEKGKKVKFDTKAGGKAEYAYATMDMIVKQVKDLIGANGFSYAFKLEEMPNGIKAICIVKHKMGHSETSDFTAQMAGTSLMSSAQIAASKSTYAKRYAFCNAFGITTGDEDDDAPLTKEEAKATNGITQEQKDTIDELAQQAQMTKAQVAQRVRELYSISITDVSKTQADGIIASLKKKIEKTA